MRRTDSSMRSPESSPPATSSSTNVTNWPGVTLSSLVLPSMAMSTPASMAALVAIFLPSLVSGK